MQLSVYYNYHVYYKQLKNVIHTSLNLVQDSLYSVRSYAIIINFCLYSVVIRLKV